MWLVQLWLNVRSSLWFTPGLFVLAAVAIAFALVSADMHVGAALARRWPDLLGASAAGARTLLATLASSMITIAGVVFSITIVALSLASSQYTPRILRNFMGDRVNQAVLGTFVAIFAYCLVVMRTVRGADEGGFVPTMAILFALVLAFVGIAMLIYFIHHISTSIQAVQILAEASDETMRALDHAFASRQGEEAAPSDASDGDDAHEVWHAIESGRTGYVQGLDVEGLLALAAERGTVVRLEHGIGDFVIEGMTLACIRGGAPDHACRRRLAGLFAIGRQRTIEQDPTFGVQQIVDVALRALSPGMNDTATALMCVDYLTAVLTRLNDRRILTRYRSADGALRLITRGPTYAGLVGASFDSIRRNAGGNVAVLESLLDSLEWLGSRTREAGRRRTLLEQAQAVDELAGRTVAAPDDRRLLAGRAATVMEALGGSA